jgi:ribosomal protein L22
VDIETRRKKQRALMRRAVERKVRSRAQQIYESRGQMAGQELQDWFQAEAEVLENKLLAPMYRHMMKHGEQNNEEGALANESADPSVALEITL